jgi:precorrin-3B methylase
MTTPSETIARLRKLFARDIEEDGHVTITAATFASILSDAEYVAGHREFVAMQQARAEAAERERDEARLECERLRKIIEEALEIVKGTP